MPDNQTHADLLRAVDRYRTLCIELQRQLDERVLFEQAKGVLAERHNLSIAAAQQMLLEHSDRLQIAAVTLAGTIMGARTPQPLGHDQLVPPMGFVQHLPAGAPPVSCGFGHSSSPES